MNASIQHPEPNGIVQPSGDQSWREETLSAWRTPPGRFTLAGLLAGLVLLLVGAPAARADRSPPGCTGSGLGISLFTSLPDVHIGDTIYYSVNVFNAPFPACNAGETNPATAGAIRAFVVTPDGVTNNITLRRTFLAPGDSDFYTNVVSYVVRAQDILPDGTVRATAVDQGDIHQNDVNSSGGGNQGVNTQVNLPCVLITARCVGSVGENGAITFTGTVTNCGNNTLVGVTVTNFVNNGASTVLFPTNLAIGQVASFSGSWVPLNPCSPSTATLTVLATDQFTSTPRTVTSFTTITCQNTLTPGIKVTKVCPAQPVSPGQLLTFSGSVSNTGNITLTNIVVVNNQPVANTPVFTLASLAPGAVTNFTGSYLAPTNCSVADTLTATGRSICGVAVTNTVSATCPILITPQITVTAVCPVAPVLPGGSLTYSGTVSNAGNITLTNIVVVSDRPASNTVVFTRATLAPGASTNFTGTYTVPTNACSVTTTFSGTGKDICTLNTVTNAVSTTCTVTTTPGIAVTLACPAAPAAAGGLITYTGTVTNSGNVTLNNVTVVNNQASPSTVLTVPSLAPHASANFTASFTAPTACSVSSTVTATGSDNCTSVMVTNTASATCTLITTPGIKVTKVCPAQPVSPGQLLTFSGSVSNTGNVTLTNIVVVNNQPVANTPVFTLASLAPGAVANFTGSYLAPTNCSVADTLTATGRSTCGVAVTNTLSATCPITTTPLLTLTQVCPVGPTIPGGLLTYSGSVSNAGNVTLTNVVVLNNLSGATPVFTTATLAPGAVTNFTGSYVAPTSCSSTSTSTATGRSTCGVAVTNTASTTCPITTTPLLTLTQVCPVGPTIPGGLLTYSGSVSNAGNVTLTNVVVLNNLSGATPVFTTATLAPGTFANFIGSYVAPTNCSSTSTSTATGRSTCGVAVTNTASTTCPITTTPGIIVTKVCPAQPVAPGQLLTFSGSVSNSGNVTLTNIVVVNNQPVANTLIFTVASLAPGAVTNFTGSYVAPTNCSVADTLTTTGRSICGVAVTNTVSATCTILTAPAIEVTQTCPITSVVPGGILTYSGTVSNAGNITLTNIVVVNNRPANNTVIFTAASLAPGATTNFKGSYQVPINCCVVWSTVQASGQGCAGITVTDTDTSTCTVLTLPQIVVTKTCAPGVLRPGDLLTYSGSVSNAGNITLINVTVANNQPGTGSLLLGPITLAPGQSVNFYASCIVPADFCGSDTVTASGLDACFYAPVTNSVTTTCPVTTTPRITVTKNCPLLPTPRGGLFTYTGSVSNAGNVTLVNVFVMNHYETDCYTWTNGPVIGPITLAPGASVNFGGSYTAPQSCCQVMDTLTASGQDRCSGSNVTATATAICPLLTTPSIAVVQNCPANPIPMGSLYVFGGYVTNTGDAVLTNVFVFSPQGTNMPVLGPIDLAPGESETYSGSYTVPLNICSVSVTASGQDICGGNVVTNTASCPVATTPIISITESCPPGPVTNGSSVVFGGSVCNSGNITLTNIFVFSGQPSNALVLGPITLAPGACAPFTGSYIAIGGSNRTTNSIIVTNSSSSIYTNVDIVITTNNPGTVTTNTVTPTFGTIDPVSAALTDRFNVPGNLHGFMYADQDENWGPTLFYATQHPASGPDTFDTISAAGVITPRFNLTKTNYDALTLAAPDVGYGSVNFYYLRHDNLGACTFGEIIAQGASSSTDLWPVTGTGYTGLAFAAANVGSYGANLFYYVRTDNTGLSTFGTINPTPGGVETDRYTVGTNFDALVFVPGAVSTWGTAIFAYLRHDNTGSIIGTIDPVSHVPTDRLHLGTNFLTGLTFTATDVGYGPNLFYYLRPGRSALTTNTVTTFTTNTMTTYRTNTVITYTTNNVVSFTPTNTVTASGMDICQTRTVAAAANCLGPLVPTVLIIGTPKVNSDGFFGLSFPTENGESYTVQYKNTLNDPAWTDLVPPGSVPGTGGLLTIYDPSPAALHPTRFYRVMSMP